MKQTTPVELHTLSLDFLEIERKENKNRYSAAGMLGGDPFVPHGRKT